MEPDDDDDEKPVDIARPEQGDNQSNGEAQEVVPTGFRVVEDSQSRQLVEAMLSTYYTPLEVWYARSVIDKVTLEVSPASYSRLNCDYRHTACPVRICPRHPSQLQPLTMLSIS